MPPVVSSCNLVGGYQYFGRTYYLELIWEKVAFREMGVMGRGLQEE
jgi:hypothetical protein